MRNSIRDPLFRQVIEYIEGMGMNPDDLWFHIGRIDDGNRIELNNPLHRKKMNNTIKNMDAGFVKAAQHPGKEFIQKSWAAALVYAFKVPVEMIAPVIHPTQKPGLTPEGTLEAMIFPIIEGKLDDGEFEETVKRYINRAEHRIWISEFLPGLHELTMPKRSIRESWIKIHRAVYDAIKQRMSINPNLQYKRALRLYVDSRKEPGEASVYYAIATIKALTARHMARIYANYPDRVSLSIAPLADYMSYILIDDQFLIKESYRNSAKEGILTYELHKLTVEHVRNSKFLRKEFNHYENEFGDIIERVSDQVDFTSLADLKEKGMSYLAHRIQFANYESDDALIKNRFRDDKEQIKEEFENKISAMINTYETEKKGGTNNPSDLL